MKLYSTPGNVALQAEKNEPPNCQELFSKTLPCYVHCNHCHKKIYEKTYKCCLFMLCLTQKYKKNIVRKDGMVKEQSGEVFLFFLHGVTSGECGWSINVFFVTCFLTCFKLLSQFS